MIILELLFSKGSSCFLTSKRYTRSKFTSPPGVLDRVLYPISRERALEIFSYYNLFFNFFLWSNNPQKRIPCLPSLLLLIFLAGSSSFFKMSFLNRSCSFKTSKMSFIPFMIYFCVLFKKSLLAQKSSLYIYSKSFKD